MSQHKGKPSLLAAYADLFEKILDPMFLLDPSTQAVLEMNPAAERFLSDWGGNSSLGALTDLISTSDREEFSKELRVSARRYHPRHFEQRWGLPKGHRDMDLSAGKIDLSDGGSVLQVIARDVTEKKASELRLQELLEELKKANQALHEQTIRDAMTGLFNYRHFIDRITHEHNRSARYSAPYSVVFCDIDHFKNYNDKNGHPAGDALLKKVAEVILKCGRLTDIVARYGGEEFVVLCPNVEAQGALILAERIRRCVAEHVFPHSDKQPLGCISVSVGVASYPRNGAEMKDIIEAADEAMYHSKESGRNQVTCAVAPAKKAAA